MTTEPQTTRPSGRVAFLFTDVVGSTRLWAADADAMALDLDVHDRVTRSAIEAHSGYVFFGAGDSFGAAFTSVDDAIDAAAAAQRELVERTWMSADDITVRMGIHVGEAVERGGDYFGPPVNVCARLMSVAHGGQILASADAMRATGHQQSIDLGEVRLRDVEPALQVRQVVADGLDRDFPPLAGADHGLSTLPSFRSSFVGRRTEIDRVRQLLSSHRLVTITGVGGVGKTRMAIEAAAQEAQRYTGTFFVDLASVDDQDDVARAFAAGIELAITDPMADLVRYLSTRNVLLVVDNCEHLLDPIADLLVDLLGRCPGLRVVATSREELEIDGEETYRLPSLVADQSAMRLFVERATAVNDRFELTEQNRATIVELCERLDGMPLAIELAASRNRSQSPSELLAGLDDRFSLLRAGRRRGVLQRQRTLEATIDWSYDLLEPSEQRFFRHLGIFAGPFLFELVPGVTGNDRVASLELLDSLVAKSLVTTSSFEDGSTSYRLLETLRSYAIDRLAQAGETEAVALRHRDAVAHEFGDGFIVESERLIRFRHQIAEVFAAFDRAIEDGEPTIAASILCGANIVIVGSLAAAGLAERVELLHRDWSDALDVEWRARVSGELSSNQMGAGDYIAGMQTTEQGLRDTAEASLAARHQLHLNQLIFVGSVSPRAALTLATELAEEYERQAVAPDLRHVLASASFGIYALNHRLEHLHTMLSEPSIGAGHHMAEAWRGWMAHLTGTSMPSVEPVGHVPVGAWEFSARIGRCMGSDRSLEAMAHELVDIADTFRHGRLPFEDSEYLTAFARIALLSGDIERAEHLAALIINRSPWCGWALAETVATLEAWPTDEWHERFSEFVVERYAPQRMEDSRARAPAALDDELDRWRSG